MLRAFHCPCGQSTREPKTVSSRPVPGRLGTRRPSRFAPAASLAVGPIGLPGIRTAPPWEVFPIPLQNHSTRGFDALRVDPPAAGREQASNHATDIVRLADAAQSRLRSK